MTLPSRFFAARVARAALSALAALTTLLGCAGAVPMHDLPSDPGAFRSWFEGQRTHGRAVLLLSPV